jgi:hypothetical protein
VDKSIFYLPADFSLNKFPAVRRSSPNGQMFKRIGLWSCGVVFLAGLQLLHSPAVETVRTQLNSSDSLHLTPLADAMLEETREGEHRLVLGLPGSEAFTGILFLIAVSLFLRELSSESSIARVLYASRAPPIV